MLLFVYAYVIEFNNSGVEHKPNAYVVSADLI